MFTKSCFGKQFTLSLSISRCDASELELVTSFQDGQDIEIYILDQGSTPDFVQIIGLPNDRTWSKNGELWVNDLIDRPFPVLPATQPNPAIPLPVELPSDRDLAIHTNNETGDLTYVLLHPKDIQGTVTWRLWPSPALARFAPESHQGWLGVADFTLPIAAPAAAIAPRPSKNQFKI